MEPYYAMEKTRGEYNVLSENTFEHPYLITILKFPTARIARATYLSTSGYVFTS